MKKINRILFIFFALQKISAQIPSVTQDGMYPKVQNFTTFSPAQNQVITNELMTMTASGYTSHPEFGKVPYNTQCTNCTELIDKRTESSRYFVRNNTNGKTFFIQKGYAPLHYLDNNNNLISIDARLRPHPSQANTFYAPSQQMPTLLNTTTGSTSIKLGAFDLVFNVNPKVYQVYQNNDTQVFGNFNSANTSVGEDGARTVNAWPGINRTVVFDRGSIKTNFIINSALNLPLTSGWLAFEDAVTIPAGYKIIKDSVAGNFSTPEGYWTGDFKLIREIDNVEHARWSAVFVLDGAGMPTNQSNAAYQVIKTGNNYLIRAMVNVSWLSNPGTVYPVTVDPLVSGTNTWTAGKIGFTPYTPGNGFCGNSASWCLGGPLTVIFPGQATITNVLWSANYIAVAPTVMQDGGFRMVGPCGENPIAANSWWSCASIFSGTCTGLNAVVPNLATCLAPSCFTTAIDFFIKNIHCNNQVPGACNIARLYTAANTWIVTVQGQTVAQPPTPLSSAGTTICSGQCTTLTATGQWGVPPYTYMWTPGNIPGNPATVCPPPSTTTNYTCTITDVCGLTATNVIAITTQSATLPTPVFQVQMNPVLGTPCPVTVTACTDVGNNYGAGAAETFTWNFGGGAVTGGGPLVGSNSGPNYGGAAGSTLCAGGTSYTIVYNATGTYTLGVNITKGANCAYGFTTIAISCPVLPIELTEYYLNYNGDVCDIYWTTSSEKNSEYFIVEKSLDAVNYSFLEKVAAAGNSTQIKKYSVRDYHPARYQVSYYRLKQFTIGDNTPKLNLVEMLNPNNGVKHQIKIHPNPANSTIDVYLPETLINRNVKLQVFDNAGKKVLTTDLNKFSSLSAYQLNIESLHNGMYSILIFDESGNTAKATFIKN